MFRALLERKLLDLFIHLFDIKLFLQGSHFPSKRDTDMSRSEDANGD